MGPARDFLQNLVSNDVEKLTPGHGLYAALLSPQGKIGFDFLVVEGDGAILLDVAADGRDVSLAWGVLFAFGLGAALPWILLGRLVRLVTGGAATEGMMGKAFLALSLFVVAGLGLSGFDQVLAQAIDQGLVQGARELATRY